MNEREFYFERINLMSDLIEKGVVLDNDKKRKFDILDYYFCIDLDYDETLQIAKTISLKTYAKMIYLLRPIMNYDINRSEEYLTNIIYKYLENDVLVEVSEEEKKEIIKFLKINDVPLLERNYFLALKRYTKGNLFTIKSELGLEENKDLTLIKK